MIDGNIDVLSLEGMLVSSVSLEGDLLPIGPKGDKGDPGFSPVVTTSKSGKTTTVKFETATGNVYAYIQDGEDGQGSGDMLTDVYDKNKNGIVDNAEKVNGKTVEENVPANAVFTDTIYDDTEVRNLINAKPDFTDIPTNVSELTNDAHYVSSDGTSTVSGENTELFLNGTTEGMFKELDLKGNTSQNGTPTPDSPIPVNNVSGNNEIVVCGKNLFDKDNVEVINAYFAYNNIGMLNPSNSDKTVIVRCIPNTTYTISKNISTRFRIGSNTEKVYSGLLNNATYNDGASMNTYTTGENDYYLYIQYYTGSDSAAAKEILDSIQIEYGTAPTAYEAYTGKSYPINLPVENKYENPTVIPITTDSSYSASTNRIDDKSFSITCIKQNSDNKSWFSEIELDISKFKPNTTYTLSKKHISTGTQFTNQGALRTKINGAYGDTKNADSITFTTPSTLTSLAVLFYGAYNTAMSGESTITFTDIQLEEGSKVNSFTPYGTTPIELNKIGTYQDYFYKENDKWYLHKEVGKVALNGSESWNLNETNTNTMRFVVEGGIINALNTNTDNFKNNMFSEYIGNAGINSIDSEAIAIRDLKNGITIRANISRVSNLAGFKSWLSTNNVIVDYVLATPTNTEITDTTLISQLNALYKAYTYKNQTNISQSNNDLPFILNVEAFTDTYNGRYENIINMIKKVQ